MYAELREADRLKDEFLAHMSHELRTPLTGILGLSEILQEKLQGPLNEKQLQSMKLIENSGRHLLELINDLLDLAKVQAGRAQKAAEAAMAEKRTAEIKSATLALEKGIQLGEQGRPRIGLLSMTYALQLCPPDEADMREVILTNLASWSQHLLCLDDIRTLPLPITATDTAGAGSRTRGS